MRHAIPSNRQAKAAPACRGLRLAADLRLVFWTMTGWDDLASMKAYRSSGAHKAAMRTLAEWCDEGSYVRWESSEPALPEWPVAFRRMVEDGIASPVRHPSPGQLARAWTPARLKLG